MFSFLAAKAWGAFPLRFESLFSAPTSVGVLSVSPRPRIMCYHALGSPPRRFKRGTTVNVGGVRLSFILPTRCTDFPS